jgi:beta-galactosidase
LLAVSGVAIGAPSEQPARAKVPFCEAWSFHLGEAPGAETPGFDDSKWRVLDVPHDWSIELAYDPKMPGG